MTVRIITHGNNGFRSSQLLNKMPALQGKEVYATEEFEFFPFSDLDLNRRFPLFCPNPGMGASVSHSEEDVILVLISLTEIFSEGMHNLIEKIPHNQFYGLNEEDAKKWWKRVIVIFSFGQYGGDDERVKEMIGRNGGLKGIVEKAGNRYIHVSDNTTPGEFAHRLRGVVTKMKKLIIYKDQVNDRDGGCLSMKQLCHTLRLSNRKVMILLVTAVILVCILLLLVTTAVLTVIIYTTTKLQ